MPASPSQMVSNASQSAQLALFYVPELRQQANYAACSENIDAAFRNLLFGALVEWRHDIDHPGSKLRQAVAMTVQAREILLEAAWTDRWRLFHFPVAAVISCLLAGRITEELYAELADLSKKWPLGEMPPLLDTALATTLREKRIPKEFQALLDWFVTNKRMKLMHRTYSNYLSLLRRCENGDAVDEEVRLGERLFLERKKNAYYRTSRVDGGGPDNDHVVDFRLAAILKFCEEQHREMRIPHTIHRWRW